MKLPNRKKATVPKKKLKDYLLSETHPVGQMKEKLFRSIGFNKSRIKELELSLLGIAYRNDVKEITSSPHGKKYIIDGKIQSPTGKTLRIRTIWIIEKGQKHPRFITAYPV